MSERSDEVHGVRLHPDGLPVSATPVTDATHFHRERPTRQSHAQWETERRARAAEARVAELERTVAWLRSGGHNRFNHTEDGIRPESVRAHLASNPPPEWTP